MRLLVCSNSCPRWDGGQLLPRSPGGLVPMLISLLQQYGGHWVFTAPAGAATAGPVRMGENVWLHPVDFPEDVRRRHYDTISISLFLGMLHYLHDTSAHPVFDAGLLDAWAAYESVNRTYAKRIAELATDPADDWILINDPHLMMVPAFLADGYRHRPGRLVYFLGTPWCEPDYFHVLPEWLRTKILRSLLRCDVVGFHADRWADAFLACCRRFLPEARFHGRVVTHDGHRTHLVAEPFPVDAATLERMRGEDSTARWRQRLAGLAQGRKILVRADRLDLWKNLPRGFIAYEEMLRRRPELAGECWFAAVVSTPSRASARHRAYQEQTEAVVCRINERFGGPRREAASLVYPEPGSGSRNCVVAALDMGHAALANATYDGLNLFAKEAAALLPDRAPLLLSVNTGVHQQLGRFATSLDPFDINQTSAAMEDALDAVSDGEASHMPALSRRELLRQESPGAWLAAVFAAGTGGGM
jgi:trehalose 6-phosphate synthase